MPNRAEDVPSRGVIVTGGAAGIGWATARRFAKEGARVAILDRDAAAASARVSELGRRHFALQVDVGDEDALVQAIAIAHARLGRLDVLVNNAATIWSGGGVTLDLEIEHYRRLVAVNASGIYVAAREAAAIMRAQGSGGAIVNVASLAGIVAVPNRTAYSASKAAVIGLTNVLARDCAPSGIRVNAVLPGFTATEAFRASQRERSVDSSNIERRIPLGRLAEPDEIAAVIQHLASNDARLTIGALLAVDGGFHSYGGIDDASAGGMVRPEPRADPGVAMIVGANPALAAALVTRLTARGGRLVLLGSDAGGALQDARSPGNTIALRADLLDRSSVEAAVRTAVAHFSRIDLLVNASDASPSGRFREILDDGPAKALLAAQAIAPVMIAQRSGAIVNLCTASRPATQADAGRSAARAAMVMLSRSLACEWARYGIRTNAVIPDHSGRTAESVAAAIDFLGSHDASYVTGATYVADSAIV